MSTLSREDDKLFLFFFLSDYPERLELRTQHWKVEKLDLSILMISQVSNVKYFL